MSWFDYRCLNLPYAAWLYLLLVCFPMFSLSYLYLAFPSLKLCPIFYLWFYPIQLTLTVSPKRNLPDRPREDVSLDITVWEVWKNHVPPDIGDLVVKSPATAQDYAISVCGALVFCLHTYIRECMSTSIYSHTSLPLFLHLFSIAQIHHHHLQSHHISHHHHHFSSLRLLLSQGELFSCSSAVWRC